MKDLMAGSLGRLNGRVTLWLARCAAFVLALLAILTFIDVVGRYAFSRSLSATVELTELGMGLIVYLSVGLVTHQRGNVAVDFVTIRLPKSLQSALDAAVQLIALGYLGVLVWRLFLRAGELLEKNDYTPILHVPLWPVAFAMALGAVFFLTSVFLQLTGAISHLVAGRAPDRTETSGHG